MKSRRTLQVAWLLAAFLWAAAPAPGQEVEIPELFSETIDVRVVNVEVVVTDRRGNRVQGLKPSDFELLVDGEPTPIAYFTEIEDGLAQGVQDGDLAAVPSVDPDAPVGTNFLIFIDDLFSIERDRNRVLDRLRDDIGELGPADRIAAVAYDGQTVETLTAWTKSAGQFEDAMDRARSRPAHGLQQLSARNQVLRDQQLMAEHEAGRDQSGLLESGQQASSGLTGDNSRLGLSYREKTSNQLESSVLAAMATMRQFANRSGRKVMLVLAGGWPRSVEIFARERLPGSTLPVAGEWLSVVEVRVTAMDEGGNRSEVSFEKVPISGAHEPEPGRTFYYETDLELRRREHSYVITVHDPLTGTNPTSTGKVGPKSI